MNHLPLATSLGKPEQSGSARLHALHILQMSACADKVEALQAMVFDQWQFDPNETWPEPAHLPGRPARPQLVHPSKLKTRAVGTPEGHAGLIHALTHIEANAINLALDIVWRFADLPVDFYRDWLRVAQEEALHFSLLQAHLNRLGFSYGDFPGHDGLWDMAQRTREDVLARLALVPRTLEARGLDATPALRNRLISIGDQAGARLLDIILRDEIGHVAVGNHWFNYLCKQRQLNSGTSSAELAQRFAAPILKGPFNLAARRAAGFSEEELAALV